MTPATILAHEGFEQPIKEWALDYGVTPGIIIARLERGMSVADAIVTPMAVAHAGQQLPIFHKQQADRHPQQERERRPINVRHEHDGHALTVGEWARRTGLKEHTIRRRLRDGWSIEQAIGYPPMPPNGRRTPGVVSNLPAIEGTGAGSTAQEIPEITFSEKAENA